MWHRAWTSLVQAAQPLQSHVLTKKQGYWIKWASRWYSEDSSALPVVAIVGRPNVGKSALFNRLAGRRAAMVHNTPAGHVTRDWREADASLADLRFTVVDTSGLEPELGARGPGSIQARAAALTAGVLARADVTLLLMDARAGVLPGDMELARWLRRLPPPHRVLLVANKCERPSASAAGLAEAPRLGFGPAVAIAAEVGEGMADLYAGLQPLLDAAAEAEGTAGATALAAGPPLLRMAVMGLPNVGKSTLCNALLASERCLTGPEPGLTRDAVRARFSYNGEVLELVDTAGWVRGIRLAAHDPDAGGVLTQRALADGAAAMHSAHVVVLVIDAVRVAEHGEGLTHREVMLANDVVHHGRALLVVANKMDAVQGREERERVLGLMRASLDAGLPAGAGVRLLPMSALRCEVQDLLPAVHDVYRLWNLRISTGRLNRFMEKLTSTYTSGGGKEVGRVKYLIQAKGRPPTFVAWVSGSAPMTVATQNFLTKSLRNEFGMHGVPMRLKIRAKESRKRK